MAGIGETPRAHGIAVGRRPVTDGLNLAAVAAGVDERGQVITDSRLAAAPGVYAAGDVTGRLPFTHAAFEMGRIAAGNALGRRWRHVRYDPARSPPTA